MNSKIIFSIAVFVLAVLWAADGFCDSQPVSEKMISVNYPPDKTVMEFNLLGISLTVPPGSADLITAVVNYNEIIKIIPDNKFKCFSVPLSLGKNMVQISVIKAGRVVDEIYINVFRRSDLESMYVKPPADFKKDYFHMKEWQRCTSCHTIVAAKTDRKPADISAFPSENLKRPFDKAGVDSTCYSCHKTLISYPFVHSPAASWSCLSCHDQNARPVYAVKKPDTKVCFNCHFDKKEDWYSKKYYHGPFSIGKCSICHNPHASENPFELIKDTWDLCISCHIDKGSGRHIVKNFSFGSSYHPTRGKPDPSRPGKELTCASCHNPHASDAPYLMRFSYSNIFELCRKCHNR